MWNASFHARIPLSHLRQCRKRDDCRLDVFGIKAAKQEEVHPSVNRGGESYLPEKAAYPAKSPGMEPDVSASTSSHAQRAEAETEAANHRVHAKAIAAQVDVGRQMLRSGDAQGALDVFQTLLTLEPLHKGALSESVAALTRLGRIGEAIASAKIATNVAPSNANFQAQLGQLLIMRRRWKDAEEAFRTALSLDPTHVGAMGGLASVFSQYGKGDQALMLLDEATRLQPGNAGMHARYGLLLEDQHRLDAAAFAYLKALQTDPLHKIAAAGLRRTRDPETVFGLLETALAEVSQSADVQALAGELDTTAEEVAKLLRFARAPHADGVSPQVDKPLDRQALLCICTTRYRRDFYLSEGRLAPLERLQIAGPELDKLAEPASHESWSPAQWINMFLLRQTPVTRRLAVVVTMRDEGLYILEWIAHYRALGIDTIIVYSNDNLDGSDLLLRKLAEQGVITYVENRMDVGEAHHPQRKAYAHALHFLPELWEHEWVLFIDSDELLVMAPHYGLSARSLIDDAMSRFPERAPSAICFNWNWRISDADYSYRPDLLLRRFPHGVGKRGMKSFVRMHDTYSMHSVHFPEYNRRGFMVRSDFTPMRKDLRWKKLDYVSGSAQLNHYWGKSFEEFSIKKARGDAAKFRDKLWERPFDQFFMMSAEPTNENFDPPPVELSRAVDAELEKLLALPGVEEVQTAIRERLQVLLARFDEEGGLSTIYASTRAATARRYAPGFP